MDKQTLMGFVNRFYLGGQTQSAPVVSTKDTLSCSFINSAKSCVGDIVLAKNGFGDYEMGLYEIQDLIKLLNVLDGELVIEANEVGDVVSQLVVSQKTNNTKVNYGLARLDVVSKKPDLTNIPEFDLELKIDKHFIDSIIISHCNMHIVIQNKFGCWYCTQLFCTINSKDFKYKIICFLYLEVIGFSHYAFLIRLTSKINPHT